MSAIRVRTSLPPPASSPSHHLFSSLPSPVSRALAPPFLSHPSLRTHSRPFSSHLFAITSPPLLASHSTRSFLSLSSSAEREPYFTSHTAQKMPKPCASFVRIGVHHARFPLVIAPLLKLNCLLLNGLFPNENPTKFACLGALRPSYTLFHDPFSAIPKNKSLTYK